MFMHDPAHSGFSPSSAPDNGTLKWATYLGSPASASPVVESDLVYIGSERGNFYCLKLSNGELVWRVSAEGNITASAAVGGGSVYYPSGDGNLVALDSVSGFEKWRLSIGNTSSSPTVAGGVVYIGTGEGKLYAVNITEGTIIWSFDTPGGISSSPASDGGVVFFGSADRNVYAVGSAGAKIWSFDTKSPVSGSPAVDGAAVFVASGNTLFSIDRYSGKLLWSNTTGGEIRSSPSLAYGKVFIGSDDSNLYAYHSATGKLLWKRNCGGAVKSSPAVAGGKVFVGAMDGGFRAFLANDSGLLWSYPTGGGILSSPAVAAGRVLVASTDGKLYSFSGDGNAMLAQIVSIPSVIQGGKSAAVSVLLRNATSGQPVANALVSMASSLGGIFDPSYYGITNQSGIFSTNFVAPNTEGTSMISILASDKRFSDSFSYADVDIIFQPILSARITATPSSIGSGGTSTIQVSVFANGSCAPGAFVNLSTNHGYFRAPHGTTDASGNFSTVYEAPKTTQKLTEVIIAVVEKPGYTQVVLYAVVEVEPVITVAAAANPSVTSPGQKGTFTVFAEDDDAAPLEGVSLSVSAAGGRAYPESGSTSSDGRFTGTFYAGSGQNFTTCVISVNATKKDYIYSGCVIPVVIADASKPLLAATVIADAEKLPNAGMTNFEAILTEAATGSPVAGADVTFAVSGYAGTFSRTWSPEQGRYSANFTACTVAKNTTAVVSVTAAKNGYAPGGASAIVRILAQELRIALWAVPEKTEMMYNESVITRVYVRDQNGNPVRNAVIHVFTEPPGCRVSALPPLSGTGDGVYGFEVRPENPSKPTVCKIGFTASKPAFIPATISIQITVFPPVLTLPTCRIVSPPGGGIVSGRTVIRGEASAGSGSVLKVQIQVSRDSIVYGNEWSDVPGNTVWSYTLDTAGYDNGYYRIFARSFNGSAYSEPAFVDVWIENPEGNNAGFYYEIIAGGTGGIAAGILLLGVMRNRKKPTGKPDLELD
jgi:outer membrane protein assembly factor BamB